MEMTIKERPILFSGPMVRAILEGRKTMTRRVVKSKISQIIDGIPYRLLADDGSFATQGPAFAPIKCPYGAPGDRLWVRESLRTGLIDDGPNDGYMNEYLADGTRWEMDYSEVTMGRIKPGKSYPSIHMPRWASRILLEIVSVRAERLQEITEQDVISEGLSAQIGDGTGPGPGYKWNGIGYHGGSYENSCPTFHVPNSDGHCRCKVGGATPAQCAFHELWNRINGKREGCSWDANPYVWVVEFKVLEPRQ